MNALSLLVPRASSRAGLCDRAEEEEFLVLLGALETLLFTSVEHRSLRDQAVLATALDEMRARWPEAAHRRTSYRPRQEAS